MADDPAMMSSTMFAMRSQLGRKILATLMCIASLISSRPLLSDDPSKELGSAVDAQGVLHRGSEYHKQGKKNPPWMEDRIYAPRPQYPYEARTRHVTGSGLFRLTLDLSTGSVAKVAVIKSIGNPMLDNSALAAFGQWRLKPGKWKEIDVPVVFTMAPRPPRPTPAAKPIPPQR
jgi:TonB family protein